MADSIASADLRSILMQHAAYHQRLESGEFEYQPGEFDRLLGEEHLRPIIESIGVKGVADLLHVVHELVIQALKDNPTDEEQDYLAMHFARVLDWGMAAAMAGAL